MTRKAEEFVNQTLTVASAPGQDRPATKHGHVAILMALYNGAANVEAQLASYAEQTHQNWSLIVSDDGSGDDGPDRVQEFARRSPNRVTILRGPGLGFVRNFLNLLSVVSPDTPFAALSDQDDVWLPDKLARATSRLADLPDGRPGLYTGRTLICDRFLRPLRVSPRYALPPSFANSLVQNIGGGNTMVLNRAALDLVQNTASLACGVAAHDWWLYQLVTGAGGHVFYDPEPAVLYRQHGANLIGANDTARASAARLARLLQGRFRDWNTANMAALGRVTHWLTPEARETLSAFEGVRVGGAFSRLSALRRAGVYRQTGRGDAALRIAAVLNRI